MQNEPDIKICRKIAAKFPKLQTEYYHCYIHGKWSGVYETTMNGYGMASKVIPAPGVDEMLALFKQPLTMTVDDYTEFKKDEWGFVAGKLLR